MIFWQNNKTLAQDLLPACLAHQVILCGTNEWGIASPHRPRVHSRRLSSKTGIQMARYKIIGDNGIYFTTHTIVEWLPIFRGKKYFEIIIESLKYCQDNKGLLVFGYVIMLTHFHLMAQTKEGVRFQDVMRDLKKFTSKEISSQLEKDGQCLSLYVFKKAGEQEKGKRKYKVWRDEYHPQIIYTASVCRQKLRYMHDNPSVKGLWKNPNVGFTAALVIIS